MELIRYEANTPVLDREISVQIAEFERQVKFLKAEEERLKRAIQNEMEVKLIKGIKTPELTISYIGETYVETFDKERFRLENPDLYDEYVTIKPKKAFVKIGVRSAGDDD